MKRLIFLFCAMCWTLGRLSSHAAETVILSDDFEAGTIGSGLNGQTLNNALGGTASATWIDPAGIASFRTAGNSKVCDIAPSTWPTFKVLSNYEIDPAKTYALDFVQKRPDGFLAGDQWWNPHGGAVILSSNDQWMDYSGVVLRLQGADLAGWDPNTFSVYYNKAGTGFWTFPSKLEGTITAQDIDSDGLIPVRILFTGAGTSTSTLNAKLFFNGNYKGAFTINDLVNPGRLVGLVTQSSSRPEYANGHGWSDNFVLSEVSNPPSIYVHESPFPYYQPDNVVRLAATVLHNDIAPDSSISLLWSKVSGPGTVNISDAHATTTVAQISEPGDYLFQLRAVDRGVTATATLAVTLKPEPTTRPLISDDFNGGTNGAFIDGAALNNALGGSAAATWRDPLHLAKYSGSGDVVCALESSNWGIVKIINTYQTNPNKTYRLATLMKIAPGKDSVYNRSSGPVLASADDQHFEASGVNFRLGNSEANTDAPETINLVDLNGRHGTGGFTWDSLQIGGGGTAHINPTTDTMSDGYLPVRIEFTGAGTAASPLKGRLFLNGHERAAFNINNLQTSGNQIGFQTALCAGSPMLIANLVLSELTDSQQVTASDNWTCYR